MTNLNAPKWYKHPFLWMTETPKGSFFAVCVSVVGMTMMGASALIIDHDVSAIDIVGIVWPSSLAAVILGLLYGSPLNWWKPFFGLEMEANKLKLAERETKGESSETIQKEIKDWVKEMTSSRWIEINPYTYKFLKKSDAVIFKLTWG